MSEERSEESSAVVPKKRRGRRWVGYGSLALLCVGVVAWGWYDPISVRQFSPQWTTLVCFGVTRVEFGYLEVYPFGTSWRTTGGEGSVVLRMPGGSPTDVWLVSWGPIR